MQPIQVVKELLEDGISKYQIAKVCGVSWNAVHMWALGVYKPGPEHMQALQQLHADQNKSAENPCK